MVVPVEIEAVFLTVYHCGEESIPFVFIIRYVLTVVKQTNSVRNSIFDCACPLASFPVLITFVV